MKRIYGPLLAIPHDGAVRRLYRRLPDGLRRRVKWAMAAASGLRDADFDPKQNPRVEDGNPPSHRVRHNAAAEFEPEAEPPVFPLTGICILTPDIVSPVKNGGIGTACF